MNTIYLFLVLVPLVYGQSSKICNLQPDSGPMTSECDKNLDRFFFNSTSNQCEAFIYNGCGGNKNRFETKKLCQKECKETQLSTALENICRLPKKIGPCEALITRWYYDINTNRCTKFHYGGCQGNKNNFKCLRECQAICH